MMEETSRSDGRYFQNLSNGCTILGNENYVQEVPIERLLLCSQETGAQAKNATGMVDTDMTGIGALRCDQCQKFFKHKQSLNRHSRIHTGEKPYKCMWCGKAFDRKDALSKHLTLHPKQKYHANSKQSSSKETSESKKENVSICILNNNTHDINSGSLFNTAERQQNEFRCYHCPKVFTKKRYLKSHIRMHTGEKPFKCTNCGKAFSKKDNLNTHFRVHTGEKPYACPKCTKKFRQQSNLIHHMQSHIKDKTFSCDKCPKRFQFKGSLRRHDSAHSESHFTVCYMSNRRLGDKSQWDGDQNTLSIGNLCVSDTSNDEFRTPEELDLCVDFHESIKAPISDESTNELFRTTAVITQQEWFLEKKEEGRRYAEIYRNG